MNAPTSESPLIALLSAELKSLEELQAWKYYFLGCFAIMVYDWLLTFDQEVERIWRRRKNSFTVMWILIRYVPLTFFFIAEYAAFQKTWSQEACARYPTVPTGFVITVVVCCHIVFVLRTYALYARSSLIPLIFVPALFVELSLLIYTAFDERVVTLPPGMGCLPASPKRVQGMITWAVPFVFDSMIVGFTVRKTMEYVRQNVTTPVITILLRDGLVYFGVMLVSYLLNFFLFMFGDEGIQDINAGFSAMITAVMTARLILNLRAVTTSRAPGTAGTTAEVTTIKTAMVFGDPREIISALVDEMSMGGPGNASTGTGTGESSGVYSGAGEGKPEWTGSSGGYLESGEGGPTQEEIEIPTKRSMPLGNYYQDRPSRLRGNEERERESGGGGPRAGMTESPMFDRTNRGFGFGGDAESSSQATTPDPQASRSHLHRESKESEIGFAV